jgi:hypothetical protein
MRLVIHLGATKTASTFLQKCLFANETLLREHGIYLPKAGRLPWATDVISHHNLAWELVGDRRFREAHGRWSDMLAEVAQTDAETVLLSTEAFARLASDVQLRSFMARRMAELSDDVTLIYVVREPLARINSMYGQSVKTFASVGTFDDYVAESMASGLYDLEKSFRFWYQTQPTKFVALRFDELVRNGPFESLLDALQVDVPRDALQIPEDVVNPSPGPLAVEAMRLLNARVRVLDHRFSRRSSATMKLSQIAQRRAWKIGWYDNPYWGWEKESAERVARRLKGSNHRFAEAVWGTEWPLPLPVDKPRATVSLLEADAELHDDIEAYLKSMIKRYRDFLRNRPRRSVAAKLAADGTGRDEGRNDEDDDAQDDVDDETDMETDADD